MQELLKENQELREGRLLERDKVAMRGSGREGGEKKNGTT